MKQVSAFAFVVKLLSTTRTESLRRLQESKEGCHSEFYNQGRPVLHHPGLNNP